MKKKRFSEEQIIGKLREAEVVLSAMTRNLSSRRKFNLSISYRYINLPIEGLPDPSGKELPDVI